MSTLRSQGTPSSLQANPALSHPNPPKFFSTHFPPFMSQWRLVFPKAVTCPHFQVHRGTFSPTRFGHYLDQVQDTGLQAPELQTRVPGLQVHSRAPRGHQRELESGAQGEICHPRHVKAGAGHVGDCDSSYGGRNWEVDINSEIKNTHSEEKGEKEFHPV